MLIVFNCALAVVIVIGVTGFGYTRWRLGQIKHVDLKSVLSDDSDAGGVMNVLLVGSDSRAGDTAAEAKQFGSTAQVGGQRSDTIMVLHVDPQQKQASILSIPRDTWVTIAGNKGKAKINSAFDGGAGELIQTIQNNFNIPIDHYVEVDFEGFRGIVNAIGGVQIPFAAPARDRDPDTGANDSGLNISVAGCINLSGDQALSYVRTRHYQALERGRWQDDPESDLSRIDRQQDFIRRVMRKASSKASNPLAMNALVEASVKALTIDSGLNTSDMEKLARRFQSLDPGKVQMMTLPTYSEYVTGGQQAQLLQQPGANQTIDRFLNKNQSTPAGPVAIPAGSISVRVLNGSGTAGQATDTSGSLKTAGFVVSGVGDTSRLTTTAIHYYPDDKAKADTLAKFIEGDVTEVADSTVSGVDAVLETGSSFEGINISGTAAASTSTTQAVQTTTTTVPITTTTTASPFVPNASISC